MEESERSKYVILVVDDEPVIRTINTEMLSMYGYQTLEACSGNQALEVVNQETIHLLLLDVRMADGNGIELVQNMNAHNIKIPVVFYTGYSDKPEDFLMSLGAFKVLYKPTNAVVIVGEVDRAITETYIKQPS